jgi:ADP-ribose diphosphatase
MVKPPDKAPPPAIASREVMLTTPFLRVIGKRLEGQPSGEPYYSLDMLDYVSIVALTSNGSLLLVRQFRPAVEATALELPAGHVEPGQRPVEAAGAELAEETGYVAANLRLLGCLRPDTGRLANHMWVYFADATDRQGSWRPEAGIEVVMATPGELSRWLNDGTFTHALHLASLFLAVRAGCISL